MKCPGRGIRFYGSLGAMNGCFFLLLTIYVFFQAATKSAREPLSPEFWKNAARSIRLRDYLFQQMNRASDCELRMIAVLLERIREGQLRVRDIELFDGFYAEVRAHAEESRSLLWTYITHLVFMLTVPSVFRQILSGKLWATRDDLLEYLLVFILAAFGMFLLDKFWPRLALLDETTLELFVRGHFEGASRSTSERFSIEVAKLRSAAWRDGRDATSEVHAFLRTWHLGQIAEFKARLKFYENALGPIELLGSCVIAVVLLALPLLNHFSGLIPR